MVDDEAKTCLLWTRSCPSMVMLCAKSKAEINAGLVIVTSSCRERPYAMQDLAAAMTR